jgi:energy-coupling factor transport system substrate-specific component
MLSSAVHTRAWTTRDIVVTAAIAVASGIAFILFDWFYSVAQGVGGNFVGNALAGFWLIGGLLVPYIVRKPGSALFGELVASLVEASFNPWGAIVIISGLLEGAGSEAVFLATGYRNFSAKLMATAGAVGAAVFFVTQPLWTQGYYKLELPTIAAFFVLRTLSGAVLAGLLAKGIGDALVPTGVLDSFPIAEGRQQEI